MANGCVVLGVWLLSIYLCRAHEDTGEALIEQEFTENTNYCKDSVEEVHANSAPTTRLNHFLLCLSQKTEKELAQTSDKNTQELKEVSNALTKILYNPLFREDVHDFKKRLVKRSQEAPQLDESILSALVNNPEALTLVLDYLKKNNKMPQTTPRPARRRNSQYFRRPGRLQRRPPSHRNHPYRIQQIHRSPPKPTQSQKAPEPPKQLPNNPMVKGDFDRDLEFFGPSDYKPDLPYALPGDEHGNPVYPWQVGYVPIPRRR
ncbi:hypothetical protein TCAL_04292 [Tigriopus californicus]|uniref:Uncharacterized protein n=1 Tax=Tigriopus californicus TaxID=6832 RepID=A0A553NEA5_TIGCA|nr:uncharacterized protein LOC131888549 [Tigriopus californicus]TRY63745.1 hypothetical protein TCAL_04292 [Tigriopus californicus]|eukprot:TCALIF_04292-PA protein Name:"Protein of unknown function" AED:0.00 eAED:0.00 QI:192/1/1/1/1/1/2/126/260